jgi:predicted nuclease with TOPRIM domain
VQTKPPAGRKNYKQKVEELIHDLAQEREAHEATQVELEAVEQALETAYAEANATAERNDALALDVAALRKQVEDMLEGHACSTIPHLRRSLGIICHLLVNTVVSFF